MLFVLFYRIIYFTVIFSEYFAGDCSVWSVRAQVKFVIFQSKLGILFVFSFIYYYGAIAFKLKTFVLVSFFLFFCDFFLFFFCVLKWTYFTPLLIQYKLSATVF